jgi:RNA polymerase sigma factor (sigma-70 family)
MFGESLVLPILRRMGLQEAEALERAQDVWVRVLRYVDRPGGFDWVISPEDWLAELTRNIGKDFYRGQARQRRRFGKRVGDTDTLPLTDLRGDVFEQVAFEEVLDVFAHTVPGPVTAVFFLVCRQGLSEAAAADWLGVSPRTVRRYLKRARACLRRLFGLPVPPSARRERPGQVAR